MRVSGRSARAACTIILSAILAGYAPASCGGEIDLHVDVHRLRRLSSPGNFGEMGGSVPAAGLPLSGGGLKTLGLLGAAALVSHQFADPDQAVRLLDGGHIDLFIDLGDAFGDGRSMGAVTLGFIAAGRLSSNPRWSAVGADLAHSLLASWTVVWLLKVSVNAKRPSGGSYSFPSGHTATSFAGATVLQRQFGWKLGLPAYALALGTALGRMEDRHHHLSDVLFGAGIGLVLSREVGAGRFSGLGLDHLLISGKRIGVKFRFWGARRPAPSHGA